MARMFGTDGVRGKANCELTPELAMRIGMAATSVLIKNSDKPNIIVASDTRLSKDMLFCALAAGICSVGGNVLNAGVIPTPALPYLIRRYKADAAVMISASHNPMEDNGIKWFDANGYKLPDAVEDHIEELVNAYDTIKRPVGEGVGRLTPLENAHEDYINFLCSKAQFDFSGMKIALDCANGASSMVAPKVFERLGATVYCCANTPDGTNINKNSGSTHIENLQAFVKDSHADIGFAFDGDADRLIAVNADGKTINGDMIMGICAVAMHRAGMLKNNRIALTVMSNIGLKKYLTENGIEYAETGVGDRYVLEAMLKQDLVLGGEQSGHIIFLEHNTSGDGILSAVQILNAIRMLDRPLNDIMSEIMIYPQVLVNVEMPSDKMSQAFDSEEFRARWDAVDNKLKGEGKVLIRRSGTEPLIRIMLEGASVDDIVQDANYIAEPLLTDRFGGFVRNTILTE